MSIYSSFKGLSENVVPQDDRLYGQGEILSDGVPQCTPFWI